MGGSTAAGLVASMAEVSTAADLVASMAEVSRRRIWRISRSLRRYARRFRRASRGFRRASRRPRRRHESFGDRRGRFFGGLGFGYYGYPYGWDYNYPDYGYYDYSQPYSAQTWYYCWDPAGYYPYVTQCNTGWQAVPRLADAVAMRETTTVGPCQSCRHPRVEGAAEVGQSLCKPAAGCADLGRCNKCHFGIGNRRKAIARAEHRMLGKNGDLGQDADAEFPPRQRPECREY